MNKQELIEKLKTIDGGYGSRYYIAMDDVFKLVEQLDETQKVIVPQFVAEYIEFKKKYDFHVYGAMREIEDHYDKRVPDWFYENNIETFVRAWLDGYRIEEEKRYEVILSNGQSLKTVYRQGSDRLDFEKVYGDIERFTRKQLEEAGFGWVFDCEGIEIEEVME